MSVVVRELDGRSAKMQGLGNELIDGGAQGAAARSSAMSVSADC